jgi:YHS domain-containing protein
MKKLILILFVTGIAIVNSNGQTDVLRKKHYNLTSGVAVDGNDVISYFTSTSPKKGSKEFSEVYKGITYYFASSGTQSIFKANPEKWEPAYGGWCAYAMGNSGEKVEVDPATFKIIDKKLYLYYNAYFNNTLPKWNKDEANLKSKADKNWASIIAK